MRIHKYLSELYHMFIGTCKVQPTACVGRNGQAVNSSVQNKAFPCSETCSFQTTVSFNLFQYTSRNSLKSVGITQNHQISGCHIGIAQSLTLHKTKPFTIFSFLPILHHSSAWFYNFSLAQSILSSLCFLQKNLLSGSKLS